MRRYHFIGNFGEDANFIGYLREEAPFYRVNLGGGWRSFLIYIQSYAGVRLEFHFMVHGLPGGLVI